MKSVICLLAALLLSVPAFAKDACYSPEHMRAEQLLRLHSELMVITITCRQGSEGQDLPAAYGQFTQSNLHTLRNAEQTLIAFYKKSGSGNGVSRLDKLRTLLGNEFAQKVADMSAPEYCSIYRDKVWKMATAQPTDLDNQVKIFEAVGKSYGTPCGAIKKAVAKK